MDSRLPALHLHALTHTGHVRSINQDAHALLQRAHTALLADGLGGGPAGEVAAAMAVEVISECLLSLLGDTAGGAQPTLDPEQDLLRREQALRMAVTQANTAIHAHSQAHLNCAGMGTTLVLAHWCGAHLLVGHVGDSRAYRLKAVQWAVAGHRHHRHELQLLTHDHSTVQAASGTRLAQAADYGGLSHAPSSSPRLTRALGVEPEVVLELHRHRVDPGDAVLLCSDGLTDMLSDEQIESVFHDAVGPEGARPDALSTATQALVDAALRAGGRDNITVLLGVQGVPP